MGWVLLLGTLVVPRVWGAEDAVHAPALVAVLSDGVEVLLPPAFPIGPGEPDPCGPERADQRVVFGRARRRRGPEQVRSVGLGRRPDGGFSLATCFDELGVATRIEPTCHWQHPPGPDCSQPQAWQAEWWTRGRGGETLALRVREVLPPGETASRLFPEGTRCRAARHATIESGRGGWEGPGSTAGRNARSVVSPLAGDDPWPSVGAVCRHDGGRWSTVRTTGGSWRSPDAVDTSVAGLPDGSSHVVVCRGGEVLHEVQVPEPAPAVALPGTDGLGWMDVFTWEDRRGRTWHQAVYEEVVPVVGCQESGEAEP